MAAVSGQRTKPEAKLTPKERVTPSLEVEALMRTCPICGATLKERKCKLLCRDPHCGYFLSCADYY